MTATTQTTPEPGTQTSTETNLTLMAKYQKLLTGFQKLDEIPTYRPDLKAAEAGKLTQEAITLTGELVKLVDAQEQRLNHIDQVADKLFAWLDGQEGWEHEEA
ncbi:hypothetical protein EXU30_00035 [Shewanella maritima]|uniref:Uncharacterized protein n=1 Tax=Shewanella maritima TaxID=2520507 RepID=A0A411PCL6_9GAMM|nr:hypothetical protein [Shewanella maritima]QBF81258.1 hypothetical protein EXU30_00035 [Shewanella maritima]